MILNIISVILLMLGVGFILLAALGALKFQDALTRMAAVSKASTLGLTLIALALIFQSTNITDTTKILLTVIILWLTAPVAAHLLGRASLLTGEKMIPHTKNTHLVEDLKNENRAKQQP